MFLGLKVVIIVFMFLEFGIVGFFEEKVIDIYGEDNIEVGFVFVEFLLVKSCFFLFILRSKLYWINVDFLWVFKVSGEWLSGSLFFCFLYKKYLSVVLLR